MFNFSLVLIIVYNAPYIILYNNSHWFHVTKVIQSLFSFSCKFIVLGREEGSSVVDSIPCNYHGFLKSFFSDQALNRIGNSDSETLV